MSELAALLGAHRGVRAVVDNDTVTFYVGDEEVEALELHPHDVIVQALELLNVRAENV